MPVQIINSSAEFDELKSSGKLFFVDFHAVWCGPCKAISPLFEQLSHAASEKVGFYKVDIDELPEIAEQCQVRSIPKFVAFKGGEPIDQLVGADMGRLRALVQGGLASVQG